MTGWRCPRGDHPALRRAGFSYPEVGATRDRVLPAGYRHLHREVGVGSGRAAFDRAVAGLREWRMHQDRVLRRYVRAVRRSAAGRG